MITLPSEGWKKNGSFLVFRRLRQDVKQFRAFVTREAKSVSTQIGRNVTAEEIAAWMVDRWPDGSPLVRCPVAPCGTAEGEAALNYFDYADLVPDTDVVTSKGTIAVEGAPSDVDGQRCPHFAHIRKINLRDKPTDVRPSSFFRILRRGIPHGPAWHEGESDSSDRGLLFLSYQRDIEQFITLSTLWMNQRTSPEGDHGHDLLVGQQSTSDRTAKRTFGDGGTATLRAGQNERWVIPIGGGFFFTPARSVLANLQISILQDT